MHAFADLSWWQLALVALAVVALVALRVTRLGGARPLWQRLPVAVLILVIMYVIRSSH